MTLAYLLIAITVLVAALGICVLILELLDRRRLVGTFASAEARSPLGQLRFNLDKSIARTRLGISMSVALEEFGLAKFRVIDALMATMALMLAILYIVGSFLSWTLAPIAAIGVIPLLVGFVRRERTQRREKFISQMPQLARVLSNATSAGLALRTAIELASEELPEPAASEMGRVAQAVSVGESIERALANLERRLPSREVVVLASTLIVSARAGGSLITALRRIAETLDERKQTRREILTSLAEAKSTALLIPLIGIMSLLLLRSIDENAIDEMLTRTVGQLIFLGAGVMYVVGFFIFKKITRINV